MKIPASTWEKGEGRLLTGKITIPALTVHIEDQDTNAGMAEGGAAVTVVTLTLCSDMKGKVDLWSYHRPVRKPELRKGAMGAHSPSTVFF